MERPIIGITCHALVSPSLLSTSPPLVRSGVGQQYVDAVVAAGGSPICIPLGVEGRALESIYELIDGLLLPGGNDVAPERYGHERHPMLGQVDEERDELEISLATRALDDNLPILGICRGIQVLAVAAGGTLYQDLPAQFESAVLHEVREFGRDHLCHEVTIEPGSRLATSIGRDTGRVNSFHHQAVWDVPERFVVSARSSDGVIEAIEAADRPFVVGVQCHPEGIWSTTAPEFAGLFTAFVDAARHHKELQPA